MTKADLVEKVTALGDLTRRDGEVIVETIFGSVIGALQSGDKIEIRGFGSFRIRQRNPRIGRNPKTGARVEVPAKKVPYFKPSKELRDLVNPGRGGGEGLGLELSDNFVMVFGMNADLRRLRATPPEGRRYTERYSWSGSIGGCTNHASKFQIIFTACGSGFSAASRMPMTAIMRPAWPWDARCEKNKSPWHCVQPPTT